VLANVCAIFPFVPTEPHDNSSYIRFCIYSTVFPAGMQLPAGRSYLSLLPAYRLKVTYLRPS
jgi:hypothetical protein